MEPGSYTHTGGSMAWSILTGVVEWWSDEGLRDLGRRRFHECRGKGRSDVDPLPRGTVEQDSAAFIARRTPWRLALLATDRTTRSRPEVVAWADDATVVLNGRPASGRVLTPKESWGDMGAFRLLCPGSLEQFIPRPWSPRFSLTGDVLEADMSVLPEFVTLASDHYEVTYEPELDVLTSWTAFIDGEVAARQQLRHLARLDT